MLATEELIKLKELFDKGVLTQEEFDKQKQIILNKSEIIDGDVNLQPSEYKRDADVKYNYEKHKLRTLSIWGAVFMWLCIPVGWILLAIAYSKANQILIEFPNSEEIEQRKKGIIKGCVLITIAYIVSVIVMIILRTALI